MDASQLTNSRTIRASMEDGAFDHLDGEGRPISLEENPYEDPALRMAHRLLRNNGFAPAWILESKEIDTDIQRLATAARGLDAAEAARRVAELNRRIELFNLKT